MAHDGLIDPGLSNKILVLLVIIECERTSWIDLIYAINGSTYQL